jgi:hypothetical protein
LIKTKNSLVTAWPTGATVVFESLILKPYRRDKPAQRLCLKALSSNPIGVINRRNGFGVTVALKKATERKYKFSFSCQDCLAI